jgi:hypothetical protein
MALVLSTDICPTLIIEFVTCGGLGEICNGCWGIVVVTEVVVMLPEVKYTASTYVSTGHAMWLTSEDWESLTYLYEPNITGSIVWLGLP